VAGGSPGTAGQIPSIPPVPPATDELSCAPSGQCGLGGFANTSSGSNAMVASGSGSAFGAAAELPGSASLNHGGALVNAVSCADSGCAAGGYYTDSAGHEQALVTGGGSGSGCQQATLADGSYEAGGCFTREDAGTVDVTDKQSNLDGIDVSASSSDDVTYDDGTSVGHELTSSGTSTLSLDLNGVLTTIFTGKIKAKLTGKLQYAVPKGAKIGGLPMSGTLTISPSSGGTATVQGTVTLPPALGGGKATLKATSTVNKGLSGVTVTVSKASFLQLFTVASLTLKWTAGAGGTSTWQVAEATASTGGKKTAKLTGTLTYAGGTLKSAGLDVKNFSLAGLIDVSDLNVKYTGAKWSGKITIGSGTSATTAEFGLTYNSTGLASASISLANISLFGVLDVKAFHLGYLAARNQWTIAITSADGQTTSGSMTVTGGVITAASLSVPRVSFLGKFTIASAEVSYDQQAPNPACKGVLGDEIWCGSWHVQLPSALVSDVSGTLATADGEFASGSLTATGDVPILDGIVLTSLGGGVTINPPPTKIFGTVGLQFGPKFKGTALMTFDGKLTRTLPGNGTSGSYVLDHGDLNVLNDVLTGSATITVPGDSSPTTFKLSATAAVLGVKAAGELDGSFTATGFTLTGDVTIHLPGVSTPISGKLAADDKGMAACGSYNGHEAGFMYDWATRSGTYSKTACSELGF
jgi:hypothetical protein